MDTIQITQTVQALSPLRKRFLGVYPVDKLKKIRVLIVHGCIVNTAPSTHKGEHWVAMYFNQNHIEFFDSYGEKSKGIIQKWLQSKKKKIINNSKRVQGLLTATCGAHCIYYLFHKSKGYSMKQITRKQTDQKVTDFVNSVYSPDNELEETLETYTENQISKILTHV